MLYVWWFLPNVRGASTLLRHPAAGTLTHLLTELRGRAPWRGQRIYMWVFIKRRSAASAIACVPVYAAGVWHITFACGASCFMKKRQEKEVEVE